jgi:hypothetical protein
MADLAGTTAVLADDHAIVREGFAADARPTGCASWGGARMGLRRWRRSWRNNLTSPSSTCTCRALRVLKLSAGCEAPVVRPKS